MQGRPSCGGVVNIALNCEYMEGPVAPHAGAWIETDLIKFALSDFPVAPHAGAWIETALQSRFNITLPGRPSCGGVD